MVKLGDKVESILKTTGVKAVVEVVTKAAGIKDCGCDKRREALNNLGKNAVPETSN